MLATKSRQIVFVACKQPATVRIGIRCFSSRIVEQKPNETAIQYTIPTVNIINTYRPKAWTNSEESQLIETIQKDPYISWKEVASLMDKSSSACQQRFRELKRWNQNPSSAHFNRFPIFPLKRMVMSSGFWTRDLDHRLIQLRSEGITLTKIANELGTKVYTCRNRVRDLNNREIKYEGKPISEQKRKYNSNVRPTKLRPLKPFPKVHKWTPDAEEMLWKLSEDKSLSLPQITEMMQSIDNFSMLACVSRYKKLKRIRGNTEGDKNTTRRVKCNQWRQEEIDKLLRLTQIHPINWQAISLEMGRTLNACRVAYNIKLKRKQHKESQEK